MITENQDTKSQSDRLLQALFVPGRFIFVGAMLCVVYWVTDAAMDAFVFNEGTFLSQLLAPPLHGIWMRLPVLVFIIGLSIYARITVARVSTAEAQVAQSENKYRTIFESIHDVYYETDLEGKILEVGPSIEVVSGYTREELLGHNMAEFYQDPETRAVLLETIQRSGVVNDFELNLRIRDGSGLPVSITSKLMYDEQGAPAKIIGALRDIGERVRAEKALRSSEDLLRSTIESSGDGILVVDTAGKVTHTNTRFYNMWFIPEELRKIPDDDRLLEFVLDQLTDPEAFLEKVRHLYESPDQDMDTLLFKDGRIFDRLSYPLVRRGQILGRIWTFRDISERMKTEKALQESQDKHLTILDNIEEGYYEVGLDGRFRFFNTALCRMIGYSATEMQDMRFTRYVDRATEAKIIRTFRDVFRSGKTETTHEWSIVRKDRDRRYIEASVSLMKDSEGQPLYFNGIVRDVTERKHWETALQESEERLARIFSSANDGIFILDPKDAIVVEANPKAAEMLEYSVADLAGMPVVTMHPNEMDALLHFNNQVLAEGAAFSDELTCTTRSGKVIPVEISASSLTLGGRSLILAVVRDVSERKSNEEERRQLEAQVQHAQKLESLGVLAGGIAHDFNNLLAGILGFSSLALRKLPEHSQATDNILQIEKAARRAADLTRQMLAYSGQGRFEVGPVDLSALVSDISNLLAASISKKATLTYDFAEKLPFINADQTQLQQVVMNLITNASEALEDRSGIITVRTGAIHADHALLNRSILDDEISEGEYVFVEVSDNGCGMDSATLAKVFEPFFTTKFTGRGLGLAALLGIVRGHKGAVTVDSEQGRGTTFNVLFPTIQEGQLSEQKSPPPAQLTQDDWSPTGTILVADDEEVVRAVCKETLESIGLTVVMAVDGEQCVRIFREDPDAFDFVLLDLSMPKMSGDEVFKELIAIRSDIRVLLSTGYNEQELVNRFQVDKLAGFIQKPYEALDLITAVRSAWRGKNVTDDSPENYQSAST